MHAKYRWTTQLIAASALCLTALVAHAQSPATLKLGVIGPFTGPSSDFGVQMLQGIQLATEEINAVGGYMGRPFELVIKDDQGSPDVGLKGSQELATAGVVATLGFCNTGVAQKSLEVFQSAKLPLIIPCATGSPRTQRTTSKCVRRPRCSRPWTRSRARSRCCSAASRPSRCSWGASAS